MVEHIELTISNLTDYINTLITLFTFAKLLKLSSLAVSR